MRKARATQLLQEKAKVSSKELDTVPLSPSSESPTIAPSLIRLPATGLLPRAPISFPIQEEEEEEEL